MSGSLLKLDFENSPTVKVEVKEANLYGDIDFSSIDRRVSVVEAANASNQIFGGIRFKGHLKMNISNLIQMGDVFDIEDTQAENPTSIIDIASNHSTFRRYFANSSSPVIKAASITILAETRTVVKKVDFQSLRTHSCSRERNPNLYMCFKPQEPQFDFDINVADILVDYNSKFGIDNNPKSKYYADSLEDMAPKIRDHWDIYFLSKWVELSGTQIRGPRISSCSSVGDFREIDIVSNGLGCGPDQGPGRGIKSEGCAGSGASYGSKGGYGGSVTSKDNNERCEESVPTPYFYENDASQTGSGGASSDPEKQSGGRGGGLIWISCAQSILTNNANILANGGNGKLLDPTLSGAGGGSGGSI